MSRPTKTSTMAESTSLTHSQLLDESSDDDEEALEMMNAGPTFSQSSEASPQAAPEKPSPSASSNASSTPSMNEEESVEAQGMFIITIVENNMNGV